MNTYKLKIFKGKYYTLEIIAESYAVAFNLGLEWNERTQHIRYGTAIAEPANFIESIKPKYPELQTGAPAEDFEAMEEQDRERISASLEALRKAINPNENSNAIIALRDIEELIASRILGDIA